MNKEQRQAAYDRANIACMDDKIQLQADVDQGTGFDPVDDGVWVAAWIFVPKHAIPGYQMQDPGSGSSVTTEGSVTAGRPGVAEEIQPMGYSEFKDAYIQAYTEAGDEWTMANLRASWAAYQRDPKGHFLSKQNP